MNKLLPIAVAATAAAAILHGCNSGGCYDNGSAIPLAKFMDSHDGESVTLDNLRIHGIGAPADSAILPSGTSASQIYLPMRSTATTTAWCFSYSSEGIDSPEFNDTISFAYRSIPVFVSDECGAMYNYRITACRRTSHLIDSLAITDSLITNADIPRIEIYFRIDHSTPPDEEDGEQ